MKLNLTAAQQANLLKYLSESPDAEQLSANEYVADFYDIDEPLTINFLLNDKGEVEIAAAAQLLYDEAEDGWYMGDRIENEAEIIAALTAGGAI